MSEEIRTKLFQEVVDYARTSSPDEIDKAYEFFFAWAPLKIKGGTGSPGNPVAVY